MLFVLFLYGPMLTIILLSFQGPNGGLTFPMNGISLFWFSQLMQGGGVVDIWSAFGRSIQLGLVVMVFTVVLAGLAGLAYRVAWLSDELGVPVIDGVSAGVKLIESLIALGLCTSKAGAYAFPGAKPYRGIYTDHQP